MVLVVGGAGYIGAHVVAQLHGRGVIVLDDLSQGHRWAVPDDVPLIVGDVQDPVLLAEVFATHSIQAVIHLAARSIVAESIVDPSGTWDVNVEGTRALIEAMDAADVRRLVFASSAAVYGVPACLPIDENAAVHPTHPYGASKAAAESLLGELAATDPRWAVTCLRFFNAAGASPDGRLGEAHTPETHLIPRALHAARTGEPFVLHGTDHPTADGTAVRDYVHVTDIARAHVAALAKLEPGWRALNVGRGAGASVRDVLAAIQRVTGCPLKVIAGPPRPGDPPALTTDIQRITRYCGWTPKITDLDVIVATAWAWEVHGVTTTS